MKRNIISLYSLLLVLCLGWARAQAGTWHSYNKFSGAVLNVADTPDFVYYFSDHSLFRFDKATGTTLSLSKDNILSDASLVNSMAYNPDLDIVVVVYSNSNIDIITADGSTVNVPAIYGATIPGAKTVNDVTFAGNHIYLATAYGLTVLRQQGGTFAAVENRNLGISPSSVARVGDYRIISRGSNLYYAPESSNIETLSRYKTAGGVTQSASLTPIDDTHFFAAESAALKLVTMTVAADGTITFTAQTLIDVAVNNVQRTPGGWVASCRNANCYYTMSAQGGDLRRRDLTGEVVSSHPAGDGTLWAAGVNGLHRVGNSTYYKPQAITYGGVSYWLAYNPHNGKTYVKTTATNYFFPTNTYTTINRLDDDGWHDVTPETTRKIYTQWMIFDPVVPDTYYLAGWTTGLHKVVNDEVTLVYNATNSPMLKRSGAMHPIHAMDKDLNMWVCQGYEKPDGGSVMMLPRDKLLASSVSKNDWITYNTPDVYSANTKRASLTITPHTNIKAYSDGEYQPTLMVWRGESTNVNQEAASVGHLIDKSGNNVGHITYTHALVADHNDNVWLGATEGLFYFDPAELLDDPENFRVTRPITEDGQMLLNGIQVNCIAVAPDNTKWIGTNNNGLFKVSADGTRVLHHFTTLNSSLTTNCIYQVCCNPTRKSVFMTTPIGVFEYVDDDETAATGDYSAVTAVPATVWPDYTGAVTVSGLPAGSNVVVKNGSGAIVATLRASGDSVIWDACDNLGNRLPTGVYTIHAATGNAAGAAAVTRVNIIK